VINIVRATLRSFGRFVRSDIEGVTRVREHLTPIEIVDDLAEHLAAMTDTIREHQGTGDTF
jgi:class 3 adenylate cyclase